MNRFTPARAQEICQKLNKRSRLDELLRSHREQTGQAERVRIVAEMHGPNSVRLLDEMDGTVICVATDEGCLQRLVMRWEAHVRDRVPNP